MLDFVFFNASTREQFVAFLAGLGVAAELSEDDESFGVAVAETLEETLLDSIEVRYDELMVVDQSLFEQQQTDAGQHTAGVVLNLKSGNTVYAEVDPLLLGRIMEVLSPEEFGDVVNAIVDAVENLDRRPLCKR